MRARLFSALVLSSLLLLGQAGLAGAQTPTDFFGNRTITLYIGYGPGGGYDLYCRLFAVHLGRHLPGNPTVVPRNEPGAGSFKLANELYNTLPRDGSALGMIGEVLVINQVLGDPAAKFDAGKFSWIGRFADSDPVLVTRADAGLKTIKDAFTKEAIIGVPGAGSATALIVGAVNNLLGTRFKLVSGYEGSAQIKLAVERGEVQGTASTLWRVDKGWIRDNKLTVLYQVTLDAAPDLPDVPMVAQLARNDDETRLLTFFASYTTIGRSILAPPGVPADRVAALRAGFEATVADPAFIADARKQNLDLAPMTGARLQQLVGEAATLGGPLLEKAKIAGEVAK
jgi:tripartite-type tricarboxylate transporter receptor subunit TctC